MCEMHGTPAGEKCKMPKMVPKATTKRMREATRMLVEVSKMMSEVNEGVQTAGRTVQGPTGEMRETPTGKVLPKKSRLAGATCKMPTSSM